MIAYPDIDPTAIRFGPLAVRWYGLMYVIGFTVAWVLGSSRCGRAWDRWTRRELDDLIAWLAVGLIGGARLGYVVFYDPGYFTAHPLDIFAVWKGGMSFHGGLIGMVFVGWLFGRRNNRSLLEVGDFTAPLAPLGLFAGRMGNFINGELWGRAADVPWAMVFPGSKAGGIPRHPSQLYEGLLEGVALFIIVWMYSARSRPKGAVLGMFLFGYGAFRFFVEFFREPDVQLGFIAFDWLTMGQILCLPMLAVGALLLLRRENVSKDGVQEYVEK